VNIADGGLDQLKPIAVPGVRDARENDRGNCKENPGVRAGVFHGFPPFAEMLPRGSAARK
jgi:hypothetical protein